jgi:hypothetical protein
LNAKKPDFNLVHEAFVQVRQFSGVLNFGGPHVAFLSQVLAIFEGKIVDLGSTEVAQLLSYLHCKVGDGNNLQVLPLLNPNLVVDAPILQS